MKTITATLAFSLCVCAPPEIRAPAQEPNQLSRAQVERLTRRGDRLADQGDYQSALESYTQAYLGIVSRIRGQSFSTPIQPNILNREELGQEMLRMMQEEYSADELLLLDAALKGFGLMSPNLNAQTLIGELLTEEVAGFYDPDTKKMVLIVEEGTNQDPGWFGRLLGAKPTFDKDDQKTTLAHELTHALQDQLYDLNAMEAGIEKDDDMLLAFSALVEGDATLLMFVESGNDQQELSDMDPEAMRASFNIMSWMMPLAGGEAYRKSPAIFRETLIFPYFQGMFFVLSVAGENGWNSVHQAYSNPPLSTEQILHPKKYNSPGHIDVPQSVHIPDLAPVVGASWQHLGGNCLGELQTGIMLKRIAGGTRAAAGWDGDRYEAFLSEDGKVGLVQVSIWDSPQDARQYASAYQKYREMADNSVFQKDSDRVLGQHDDQVWIIEGFPQDTAAAIEERLKSCRFTEKRFPVPSVDRSLPSPN